MLDPQPEQIAPRRFWPAAALALCLGLAGQAVLAWQPEAFVQHPFRQPWVLVAVHLTSLGFFGLIFLSVALQAISVLHHRPRSLAWPHFAGPSAFALGVLGLLSFFAGARTVERLAFSMAALGSGYGWVAWQWLRSVRGQPMNTAPKRGANWAFMALGAMIVLGACMACGLLGHPLPLDPFAVLQWHIHLGLAGFAGLAILGLLPKLLRLFQKSKGYPTWPTSIAFAMIFIGLLGETTFAFHPDSSLGVASAASFLAAALAYALQLFYLLRQGLKRGVESSLALQVLATAWLLIAVGLDLRHSLGRGDWHLAMAAVYAGLFGWIGGMILGTLQKITAILAWMQRFFDRSTDHAVPTAWQLIDPRLAWSVVIFHSAASLCGLVGILRSAPLFIQAAGWTGMAAMATTLALVLNALRRGEARPF